MFHINSGKRLLGFILAIAMAGGVFVAPVNTKAASTAVISSNEYRRTLAKGFLGKRYGTVIDGVRCDCSGYAKVVLSRMKSSTTDTTLKSVKVNARCTADWVSGSTVSYVAGTATQGAVTWGKRACVSVGGSKNIGTSSVSKLKLGDVVVYGKSRRSTHMAVYFGKFSSKTAVKEYLESIGVYKKGALKKVSGNKYKYKGKTIIRSYGSSTYWRIHSTCSGIMIDNDVAGKSPYTSSFGKWKWTYHTGITAPVSTI